MLRCNPFLPEIKKMLDGTPFLLFDGNCAEAMTFYHECLGGELTLTKVGDSAMKGLLPSEKWHRIINARLKSGEIEISATDWMAAPEYLPNQSNAFAIFVIGQSYNELKEVFDKLSKGIDKENKESHYQELRNLSYGSYGQFVDKYAVVWQFKGEEKE